ncbi:A24 family peptidase [Myceligenerans crystallogenes]|uniref:Prepilin type IV endopeptidase peptidase domain-containing protein n=1 Tax=Myceligenerans crystallogenes TaxID=316335 RepID=A0ABP4ZCZ5_9MICO
MTDVAPAPHRPTAGLLARLAGEIRPFARMSALVAVPAVSWAVWASGPSWATPAVVVLALAGSALAVIDARTHRLPNAIVYPATAVAGVLLVLAAAAGALTGGPSWEALWRAELGFAAHGGFYAVTYLIFRGTGVGLGDVKLAGILGAVTAWFGWDVFLLGMTAPYLVAGVVVVILLLLRVVGRKSYIPFGPFMLLGVVVALTWARLGS